MTDRQVATLLARVEALKKALRPFAEKAAYADALEADDADYVECAPFKASEYRAARSALEEPKG